MWFFLGLPLRLHATRGSASRIVRWTSAAAAPVRYVTRAVCRLTEEAAIESNNGCKCGPVEPRRDDVEGGVDDLMK